MHPRPSTHQTKSLTLQIFFMVVGFIIFGLLMVYNVSVVESFVTFGDSLYLLKNQSTWAVLALGVMLVTSKIPTKWWTTLGPIAFAVSVALLIAVLVPGIGTRVLGARRWIAVGGFVFQPVEPLKIALTLYLAKWLTRERRFSSFIALTAPIFGLIMLQPDLGSSLIIAGISGSMYIVSGKPIKHVIWMIATGVLGISTLILISPYRRERLMTFLDPGRDPLGSSYHVRQITLALGNGGLFGQGLGQSKQKYRYIPEAATDSIFAVIAEEFGFVLCGIIIIGYIVLLSKMVARVYVVEGSDEEFLLGAGIVAWITTQILVNLSAIVVLLPLTGVPLPFVSYGGSALVNLCAAVGILLGLRAREGGSRAPHASTRPLRPKRSQAL